MSWEQHEQRKPQAMKRTYEALLNSLAFPGLGLCCSTWGKLFRCQTTYMQASMQSNVCVFPLSLSLSFFLNIFQKTDAIIWYWYCIDASLVPTPYTSSMCSLLSYQFSRRFHPAPSLRIRPSQGVQSSWRMGVPPNRWIESNALVTIRLDPLKTRLEN